MRAQVLNGPEVIHWDLVSQGSLSEEVCKLAGIGE